MYKKYFKRMMDFILASISLSILSPLLLILFFLIYYKIGTPVLFTQPRPGKDGRIFKLYKFRTMANIYDEAGLLLPDEQRLMPFGIKLRETSLDELPSLFNVIKGDMALVGPRPLLVKYLNRYNQYQARRHEVRPGFTGYAQINGRNSISWEDKFNFDVYYVDHVSFLFDLRILFKTIKIVLERDGITSKNSATMEEFMGNKKDNY